MPCSARHVFVSGQELAQPSAFRLLGLIHYRVCFTEFVVNRKFLKDAIATRVATNKGRVPISAGCIVALVEGLKPTGQDTIRFTVPGEAAVLEMPSDDFRDVTERID
jgi:hypothetical protein